MEAFDAGVLAERLRGDEHGYEEFFRAGSLSLGFAFWPAQSEDAQQPHREDEVYYVVSGRGTIRVDGEDRPVGPGSIVYVAAHVEHRFHSIVDDLEVVVFWSPPRGEGPDTGARP